MTERLPEDNDDLQEVLSAIEGLDVPPGPPEELQRRLLRRLVGGGHRSVGGPMCRTVLRKHGVRLTLAGTAAALLVLFGWWVARGRLGSGPVFAEILDKLSEVRSVHARLTQNGREIEFWAARPNKLRVEEGEGRYTISDGPTLWEVDQSSMRATRKPSFYYVRAQRRGVDVLDLMFDLVNSDLSGFFYEGPSGTEVRDGVEYLKYESQITKRGETIRLTALVDPRSELVWWMSLSTATQSGTNERFELEVLEHNLTVSEEKFLFDPSDGWELIVEENREERSTADSRERVGSSLSGRIVWAKNLRPTSGARVTVTWQCQRPGEDVRWDLLRAETGTDGRWRADGVPAGPVRISVRSWELDWPAVPTFANNTGSAVHPAIIVDGVSEYTGLNFKVYKPNEVNAHFVISVVNAEGEPIEGVGAFLVSEDEQTHHGWIKNDGQQYCGKDGRLDAYLPILPETRVYVVLAGNDSCPYATHTVQPAPFTVESRKKAYSFRFEIPLQRSVGLRVVDPDGNGLEGIHVMPDVDGRLFHAEPIATDSNGELTIPGVVVGRRFGLTLKLLRPEEDPAEFSRAIACAVTSIRVPEQPESKRLTVVFDTRPIRIEASSGVGNLIRLYCGISNEPGEVRPGFAGQAHADPDESGRCLLEGVPAGEVTLVGYLDGPSATWQETMETRPGTSYTVHLSDAGLEILSAKLIE